MTFIHSMRISFYMDFTKPYFFVVPMQLVCDTFTPSTHSCSEMSILIIFFKILIKLVMHMYLYFIAGF